MRLFSNESRCPELHFPSNLNIPPVVVLKLELLNMTVGMVSEVKQLLLSVRKLNLCDTCLLSSRKLACIVLKHRMEMLRCLLSKPSLCPCVSVWLCVKGFRPYYIWQISTHLRWHFYLKGTCKWREVGSRKEGTRHLLRASCMPDSGLDACLVHRGAFSSELWNERYFKKGREMRLGDPECFQVKSGASDLNWWRRTAVGNCGRWFPGTCVVFWEREGVESRHEGKGIEERWGFTVFSVLAGGRGQLGGC